MFLWYTILGFVLVSFICNVAQVDGSSRRKRNDNCVVGDGSTYRGSTSTTKDGVLCQKWSSQWPNPHRYWTQNNRDNKGIGNHNHCRNPDGDSRPWCITASRKQLWDYCDIPTCQTSPGHQCPARLKEDAMGPFFIPNTLLPLFGDIAPPNEVDLYVEGVVYDSSCRPVPGAKVEVWHASPHKDGRAFYSCRPTPLTCTWEPCTEDVVDRGTSACAHMCIPGLCNGTRPGRCSIGDQSDIWDESTLTRNLWYRGLGYTNKDGQYYYTTSFPGTYKVRPVPHIHYKVTYPGGKEMVTQLYFEGHNSDREQRNQVKEVVPVVPGFGRVTFHIYPENFENLRIASCPFNRSQQP